MEVLKIYTKRLLIRNLQPADLKNFHVYRSNPEVTKYQGFDVMTMEQAKEFIFRQKAKKFGKPGEWVQYGIEEILSRELIGDCAIKLDSSNAEIAETGITISPLYQQKGFAKETFEGIMTFLFGQQHIHRIRETVDTENMASIRLLQSLGFRQEAHFIRNIWFNNKWGSEYVFAMLKDEWDKKTRLNLSASHIK